MKLRWQATFIDVEPEEDARGDFRGWSAMGSRRRTSSEPASPHRGGEQAERAEVFGEELTYVASLGRRLEAFMENASWKHRAPASEASTRVGSPVCSTTNSFTDFDDIAWGPASRPNSCSPVSKTARPSAQEEVSAAICNPGSAGHPELCMRPCIYFASGHCTNGNTCEFCHLGHPKRPVHLDKRHRELLRSMATADVSALVLPVIKSKVDEIAPSEFARQLVNELYSRLGVDFNLLEPVATNRHQRMLVLTLNAMSLRSLLTTFTRMFAEPSSIVESLCEDLLKHVRGTVLV